MQYTQKTSDGICTISMDGQFTFSDNMAFRAITEEIAKHSISQVNLDVSNLDYVDSAALGMFLLLREFAQKRHINLTLIGPQGQVKKVFDVSRFDQLFKIA